MREAFGFQGLHPLVVQMLTGRLNALFLNPSRNYVAKTILAGGEALGLEKCLEFLENPGREAVRARVWSAPAAEGRRSWLHLLQPIFRGQFKWGWDFSTPLPNWTVSTLSTISPPISPPPASMQHVKVFSFQNTVWRGFCPS